MRDSKAQVIIAARDAARGVINRIAKSTRAYHRTLNQLNTTANKTTSTLARLAATFAGLETLRRATRAGYQFNSTIEETRVGIASLIYSMREMRTENGRLLSGSEAWNAAMAISNDLQKDLRIAGLKTAATYEQLTDALSQAYVPAAQAAFDDRQVVQFTVAVTQAAAAMRIPMNQLGEEVRSILSGTMNPRNTRLFPLMQAAGLTNEKIKELIANGRLFETVMKALSGSIKGADEASKNLSVRWSNLLDAISQILGAGMRQGFERTKQLIKELTDSIATIDEKTRTIEWNPAFLSKIQVADRAVFALIEKIRDLSREIVRFKTAHPIITDLAAKIAKLVLIVGAVAISFRAVGRMVIWLKAVVMANVAMITTLLGPIVATLSSISAEAAIAAGALSTLGAAVGAIATYFLGWKIGRMISDIEIIGLKIGEAIQAGYARIDKFGAKVMLVFETVGVIAKAVFKNVNTAIKVVLYEVMAILQKIPGASKVLNLTEDMKAKADEARQSYAHLHAEMLKGMDEAKSRLQKRLEIQDRIIDGIYEEANARNKGTVSKGVARIELEKLTTTTKNQTDAAKELVLAHRDVNSVFDRMEAVLGRSRSSLANLTLEMRKLTATPHQAQILDVENAFTETVARARKQTAEAVRIVREFEEKIAKAKEEAAAANAKRSTGDPIKIIDPAIEHDLTNARVALIQAKTQEREIIRTAEELKAETINRYRQTENLRVAVFLARQKEAYVALTDNVSAQYAAKTERLKAELAQELADTERTEAEKAAITKRYLKEIQKTREESDRSFTAGAQRALRSYAKAATDAAQNMENATTNALRSMEDSIGNFARTGKFEVRDMVNSMLADIARLTFRQSITGKLAGVLSDWIGNLFKPTKTFHIGAGGTTAVGFAGGGLINEHIVGVGLQTGTKYEFGEEGDEWVIPKKGSGTPHRPQPAREKAPSQPPPIQVVYAPVIQAIDTQSGLQFLASHKDFFVGLVQQTYRKQWRKGPLG